jgi:hypothetical protein
MPDAVSDEELRSVVDGPAIYSNKMYVTAGPVIRITFSEQLTSAVPQFRTAVAMAPQDAIALKNLLIQMLEPIEAEIAKAIREQGLNPAEEK